MQQNNELPNATDLMNDDSTFDSALNLAIATHGTHHGLALYLSLLANAVNAIPALVQQPIREYAQLLAEILATTEQQMHGAQRAILFPSVAIVNTSARGNVTSDMDTDESMEIPAQIVHRVIPR